MPEVLTRLQQRITDFWKDLEKSQKTRILVTSGVLLAAILVSVILLTKTTYVPLISSTDKKELSEMASILDGGKFKYKLTDDSILVDSKNEDKAQALLVKNDYPKSVGSIFSDAFDKVKLSNTESDKRKLFIEAQERTMATKLKMFDYIEDASVQLAIPEPSIFILSEDEVSKPTASVMIKPKETLTQKQIHAVVMWVAKSVENLDPKDITVVDYNLNELTTDSESSLVDNVSNQYEMRKLWASDLERSVRKMFNGQFDSFDNIAVVANPVLNFDKLKSSSKTLTNPQGIGGPAVISSDKKTTNLVNGTPTGGAPGVSTNPGTANSPSYQLQTANGENSTYNEKHDVINNAYDEVVTDQEKATGEMLPDKSSMAINLLYGGRVTDENKINQEIEKVKQIASSATGIPVTNISVNKFKLAAPTPVQTKISDTVKDLFNTYGTFALVILLLIGLAIAVLPRRRREEGDAAFEPLAAMEGGPRFIVPDSEPLPEIELEERSEVKKQIEKFVKQKPEAVAHLLRNWLSDEWEG